MLIEGLSLYFTEYKELQADTLLSYIRSAVLPKPIWKQMLSYTNKHQNHADYVKIKDAIERKIKGDARAIMHIQFKLDAVDYREIAGLVNNPDLSTGLTVKRFVINNLKFS